MTFFRLLAVDRTGQPVEEFLDQTNQRFAVQEARRCERYEGFHDIRLFKISLLFGNRWLRGNILRALRTKTMSFDFEAADLARRRYPTGAETPYVAGDNHLIHYLKEIPVHGRQRPAPVVVMAEEE